MNLPTSGGPSAITSIVSAKAQAYELRRPSHETGARGGTETTTTHEADIWVFSPREVNIDTEYGDRLTGGLGGLALPPEDIQQGDRLTYQGIAYEVTELVTTDDSNDVVTVINLTRRTNDS